MIEQLDTSYGKMFIPNTDNGQYDWLKNTGASPEDEIIELVCELLDARPKGVALDCGANFGCWSLPLAKHANIVFAFEPQRVVFNLLQQTILANEGLQIIASNIALGNKPGFVNVPSIDLSLTTNFGGISLGVPHPEHPNAPMYSISVMSIDDIVDSIWASGKCTDAVSFIKADVEGAEFGLFLGAERTIRRFKPIIVAEADHPLTNTQELGKLIESFGYNVEIIQDNNFIGMPV